MSHAVAFPGANGVLCAPAGAENVRPLPVFRNGICCVSCWQLDAEELAEINRTGRVFITVMSGKTQPPVFVGSEETVRSVLADCGGVWKR